jgi:3-methyl-2-oxobutanoate hydroxymethyltransferase
VYHDLLGFEDRMRPRFVRRYAELGSAATDAVAHFVSDVRAGSFPSSEETYHMTDQLEGAIDMGPIDLVGDGAADPVTPLA